MAINITNILNAITAKNNAADSTYSSFELSQINRAVNTLNETNGVITYNSASELPAGDSAIIGQMAFVLGAFNVDSTNDSVRSSHIGSFYYYNGDSWGIATLASDSDFLNSAVGGPSSTHAQGSTSGYSSGGSSPTVNIIQKFSFASDANATDVGDRTITGDRVSGQSSTVSGYSSGADNAPSNVIDKFPFSTDANATDVGNLLVAVGQTAGQSSTTHGYVSGGHLPPPNTNVIQKFPFATDANAADVGDLTQARRLTGGNSSDISGYTTGGFGSNAIDKFPFSSDANATDVGDLLSTELFNIPANGQVSALNGYVAGGYAVPAGSQNVIQKFSFSTDENSTDAADLINTGFGGAGQSSTTHGYKSGGQI
jgi:hypothetical protein